jgi:site-specific recombinase XerD
VTGRRYLQSRSRARAELGVRHQRFAALRDEFVINLRYNTARAYASDLDHLLDWALERGKDVLDLTDTDLQLYLAGLLQHPYTANTITRKRTALRGFYDLAVEKQALVESPMNGWGPIRRRLSEARPPKRLGSTTRSRDSQRCATCHHHRWP